MSKRNSNTYVLILKSLCFSIVLIGFLNLLKQGFIMAESSYTMERLLTSPDTIEKCCSLLPKNCTEISELRKQATEHIQEQISSIIYACHHTATDDHYFDNTFKKLDDLNDLINRVQGVLALIEYTSPSDQMRSLAQNENVAFAQWLTPRYGLNTDLYAALVHASDRLSLATISPEYRYFIEQTILDFKRSGVNLSSEERDRLQKLYDSLNAAGSEFEANIAKSERYILATRDELPGLSDEQCAPYKQEDGTYRLTTDYPTMDLILMECSYELTRQRLWAAFASRAYPENLKVLDTVTTLRHEIAKTLGYQSFRDYQIDNSMAGSVEKVQAFIANIKNKGITAACLEAEEFLKFAQEELNYAHKQLQPWDLRYIQNCYKKQKLQIDEQVVREYFPLKQTIARMLEIYKNFLGINFTRVDGNGYTLWDPTIQIIAAYDENNVLLGHVFLDLHPRQGKFTHACHLSMVHGISNTTEQIPALATVIANFPEGRNGNDALLMRSDVVTFFHEFGHAVHGLCGRTALKSFSGTQTKRDFVELPSQMLEEWLLKPEILKKMSGHYITGDSLSDEIIQKIIAVKKIGSAMLVFRQLVFTSLSLACYDSILHDDIEGIYRALYEEYQPYLMYDANDHFITSFGHLIGYGAQYYGYLWSRVFALDIFNTINKQGLHNKEIGLRYRNCILAPGGSKNPHDLVVDFLQREPSIEPFFADIISR